MVDITMNERSIKKLGTDACEITFTVNETDEYVVCFDRHGHVTSYVCSGESLDIDHLFEYEYARYLASTREN